MYQIYKLFDPRDQEKSPKYIGITANSLELRLKQHVNRSKLKKYDWYIINWINSLLDIGLFPNIECIDVANNQKEAFNKEIYYIDFYKKQNLKLCNTTSGGEGNRLKKIKQFDKTGNFIKLWECMGNIEKELNINNSKISSVCKGNRYFAGNFVWRYEEDDFNKFDLSKRNKKLKSRKIIYQYNLKYELIKIWEHSQQIENELGILRSNINLCCRKLNKDGSYKIAKDFYWRYEKIKI